PRYPSRCSPWHDPKHCRSGEKEPRMRLALVAFALFFGAFWYTMPAPRPVFVDCAPPRAAEEIFARASALRTAERLFHDRRLIYGWSTRARLHLDNMRFWFAGRVLGYYG